MSENAPDNAGVIAPPPLLYAGPLLLGLLLHRTAPAPLLPRRLARGVGLALVGAATAIETGFVVAMRRAQTPINPSKPVARLVTDGPFRYTRNPAYLALAMYYVAIANLVNTRWPVFLLPAMLFMVQRGVIEREERYLERRFGQEYREYKARVRRWF
jgi:protein-S-isoprenylcysteine O-methyltransferase Ste14